MQATGAAAVLPSGLLHTACTAAAGRAQQTPPVLTLVCARVLLSVCDPVMCRYEGDWASALYEGHGSETFAKGSTYHGQYSSGLRHGWGMCRFFNGDYYEGLWSKGLRDGYGMQQVQRGPLGGLC